MFKYKKKNLNHLIEAIEESTTIAIYTRSNPDADAYGSQLGLRQILIENYPDKEIYSVGEQSEHLNFLGPLDIVKDKKLKKALTIIVGAGPLGFVSDHRAYSSKGRVVKIDNKSKENMFDDISIFDNDASSSSEIIALIAHTLDWNISSYSKYLLYAGIIGTTNRIQNNVTKRTLKVLSRLHSSKFNSTELIKMLEAQSVESFQLNSEVGLLTEFMDTGVAHVIINKVVYERYGLSEDSAYSCINIFNNLADLEAFVMAVEKNDGTFKVIAKSNIFSIAEIAKEFEGCGDDLLLSMIVDSLDEAETIILRVNEIIESYLIYKSHPCWFCHKDNYFPGNELFSHEFDTSLHKSCLTETLHKHDEDPEISIIAREFNLI